MKRLALLLASGFSLCTAQAAIAPGGSGNGELFLNVFDTTAKASYTLDLGVLMDDFFVAAQQDIGYQRFWVVDSANWSTFTGLVTPSNLRWSVVALDSLGPSTVGQQRLFTTAAQGSEGNVANTSNKQLSDGISTTQGGNFFNTVNALGTHAPQSDYSLNGDSYSLESDSGRGYYGEAGGLTPTINGNAPFNAGNAVGKSSWFYYLTRSGTGQLSTNKVLVDEFDNLGADGYWGFVKVEDQDSSSPFYDPDSPYAGKYLLSFTMPVFTPVVTSAFREFALSIGRTEYGGGFLVSGLGVAVAAAPGERAAGWVTPLGVAGSGAERPWVTPLSQVSAVPEPGAWALMLAGAGLLGLTAARRRGRAR